MLLKQATILLKNLSLVGRTVSSLHQAPTSSMFSGWQTTRSFVSDGSRHYTFSEDPNPDDHKEEYLKEQELFGKLPKRPPTVFALFIKEQFKMLPVDMSVKEKFGKAAETWRNMSTEEKEVYKKQMTEYIVGYREKLEKSIEGLTTEQLLELKKLKKEKLKFKTRQRIRSKLRELSYPKKPVSGYIYFLRDQLSKDFPNGVYPPVKSPEHIRWIGINAQNWRALTPEDKKVFDEKALVDKERYYAELEEWKEKLGKPENEEKLLQLERLSRKMVNTNKSEEEVKKKQKQVATKVITSRLKKKGMTIKGAKQAAAAKRKQAEAEADTA